MFRFKLAEFFSGPGGMGYGAGLSKVKGSLIEHAWASDYDQDSCNTYKRNIKTKAVFCEKVENFFKRNHFSNIVNLRDFQNLPRITLGTFE